MEENAEQKPQPPRAAARLRRRWMWAVIALALAAIIIVAVIVTRRPPAQTGHLAGAAVPSVESVSAGPSPAAVNADLTLSPEMVERAGLRYEMARLQTVANQLRTTGTVQANAYRETRVLPLVSGRVTAVRAELGDLVTAGQPLAVIFSAELAEAQMKYLTVSANLGFHVAQSHRFVKLAELGAVSQQELEEVQSRLQEHHAEHAALRQRMLLYGLTEAEVNALKDASQVRSEVIVPAPSAGVITARSVNVGQVVAMTDSLFAVTDLSTVWVIGNVYEQDFTLLRLGAPVMITAPSYPERAFRGQVAYVDPRVDPQTRTAQIRVEVINPGQALKLGMFVDVALSAPGTQQAVVIPKAALQSVGTDQIVFVSLAPGRFQMRKVQTAEETGELVRILSGVKAGEQVVTAGSFFLRAEMGRSPASHTPTNHTPTS
jgi:cobalt-zinc-cadmium efflux system membrane fusion protein